MKNIKNTTKEERDERLEKLKKQRKMAVAAYIKAKIALNQIDLEMLQLEQANKGHFIDYEKGE